MQYNLKIGNSIIKVANQVRLVSGLPDIPPYTLRVEFVNVPECQSKSFDPTQGTGDSTYTSWAYGSWSHVAGSVYDWTYNSDTWFVHYRTNIGQFYASPLFVRTNGSICNTGLNNAIAYKVLGANLSGVKYIPKLFNNKTKYLVSVALFDTSMIECAGSMFNKCSGGASKSKYLRTLPDFDFSGIKHDSVPIGQTTKWATNQAILGLMYFARGAGSGTGYDLTSIPNITLPTDIDVNISYAFSNNREVASGALNLYNKFIAAGWEGNHNNCFTNCGVNTTTGAAELAQIPTSWGGTMSN